jgi:acetylornithine deacetylase/succinyl-diaminopimelate desuccinylase-like protein
VASVVGAGTTGLSAELQASIARARATLDDERLADLAFDMTAIPSPTGEELALAQSVVRHMAAAGLEAEVQSVEGHQANAIGRLRGTGGGPTLLLYAPLDTAFSGDRDEDRPWLGDEPRADFGLPPRREGSKVVGLGAENPKGFAAAGIAALEAVSAAGAALRGDVVILLASGSMPVERRPGIHRPRVGHGSGVTFYFDHAPRPDFAIVLKPGYAVAHEEVGLAWYRLTVRGAVNYTGIRHKGPFRNPVVAAARVVGALETWFGEYAAAHTDGLVAPQGSVNAIRAGSADRAAFIPVTCEIDFDVRLGPRTSADQLDAEVREAVEAIGANEPEFGLDLERVIVLPGTATDPDSWIVRSLIRAWEAREGRAHAPLARSSGASDAAIIRSRGIEAARIGLPPAATPNPYPGFSMGVVDVASMRGLAELLVEVVIDTASRTRREVGLR